MDRARLSELSHMLQNVPGASQAQRELTALHFRAVWLIWLYLLIFFWSRYTKKLSLALSWNMQYSQNKQ